MRDRKPRRIGTKVVKLTTHYESIISYTKYLNDTTKCGVSSKVSSLLKKMLYAVFSCGTGFSSRNTGYEIVNFLVISGISSVVV